MDVKLQIPDEIAQRLAVAGLKKSFLAEIDKVENEAIFRMILRFFS
jgi:hypothetical protein